MGDEQEHDRLVLRLKAIYDGMYSDLTMDSVLDNYEDYVKWAKENKISMIKDLLHWANSQNFPNNLMREIRATAEAIRMAERADSS